MTVLAVPRRSLARISSLIDATGSLRAVELLRIAAGPIVIAHLWPFLADASRGVVYSDRFYEPYVSWFPETSRSVYLVLLWLAVPAALALSLGAATRLAAVYSAAFVGYNLFLSRTHFWHNRAFLLVMLIGLALLPIGRAMSVDAVSRRWRGKEALRPDGPLWPLMLMRFEVAATFLGSGVSKLIDQDWWGGAVTRLRIVQWRDVAADRGVPDWLLDLLVTEGFHVWFAKFAVLVEIAIALGLLWPKTRRGAIWIAVIFHVSIEIVASVQVFSFIAIAALVIWVTPSAGDRIVSVRTDVRSGRLVSRVVHGLDWFGRFRLERSHGSGPAVRLVERDGSMVSGRAAGRLVLSRLPVTFMAIAPFNLAGLRRIWDGPRA